MLLRVLPSLSSSDVGSIVVLTFPVIFLSEWSRIFALSQSPILSFSIVIKISLWTIEESLKSLLCSYFQTQREKLALLRNKKQR